MNNLNIDEIKNLYWKAETINKKHIKAHLVAEIYYCAHIFIGIFILLMKLDYFNAGNELFTNPPLWFGVLFPLLTFGKYSVSYISVAATILCFILVPAILSVLIYLLLSTSFKKKYTIKKNPYKNARNNDIFEKVSSIRPSEPKVVRALRNRIHVLVWIQVLCFAVLFAILVVYGTIQGTIKPEELVTGIICGFLVAPSYSIVLYLLRWIESKLFNPMDKIFTAIFKARIESDLNSIKESSLYSGYVKSETAKVQAKRAREEREKKELDKKYAEALCNGWNPRQPEPDSDSDYRKRMGYDDGVSVDGRGI